MTIERFSLWLSMGGYGAFVWPAYAVAALVLALVLFASLRRARRHEQTLAALQFARGRRRDRSEAPR